MDTIPEKIPKTRKINKYDRVNRFTYISSYMPTMRSTDGREYTRVSAGSEIRPDPGICDRYTFAIFQAWLHPVSFIGSWSAESVRVYVMFYASLTRTVS